MTTSEEAPDAGLWTVANLVSIARLAAIPVFLWLLLAEDNVEAATVVFLLIGVTDWLDGQLARRLGQVSEIGRVLDPIADRLAIVAAVIGGWIAGVLPVWFAALLLVREVVLGLAALVLFIRSRRTIEVRYLGKMATFIVYGAIPAFYLAAAGVATDVLLPLGWIAGSVGLVLYWWVGFMYLGDYRRQLGREAAAT